VLLLTAAAQLGPAIPIHGLFLSCGDERVLGIHIVVPRNDAIGSHPRLKLGILGCLRWILLKIITKSQMTFYVRRFVLENMKMMRSTTCFIKFPKIASPLNTVGSQDIISQPLHDRASVVQCFQIVHNTEHINNWFGEDVRNGGAADMMQAD